MAEITTPVPLCTPRGRLNPAAVGWTRRPLHTPNLRGWGRTKRWEYWAIVTHDVIVGLTILSLDYAGHGSVYVLDRRSGTDRTHSALAPLARGVALPERCGSGVARIHAGDVRLELTGTPAGTRLSAQAPGIRLSADVAPAPGDSLGVVVPWSDRLFQHTVKDLGRPVSGTLELDGEAVAFGAGDGSFAVLDHGRGRWPYSSAWNWAAGFGAVAGRRVGVQLGGRWTDGTGQTENGLFVDGVLHKIDEDVAWSYDRSDWKAPWHLSSRRVEVTFAPFHERADRTNLGFVTSEVHQCFGMFTGWILDDAHHRVPVDGLVGWAEEARHRW